MSSSDNGTEMLFQMLSCCKLMILLAKVVDQLTFCSIYYTSLIANDIHLLQAIQEFIIDLKLTKYRSSDDIVM